MKIKPLKVVVDYMEKLRITQSLPQGMIPSAEEPPLKLNLKSSRRTVMSPEVVEDPPTSEIDDDELLSNVAATVRGGSRTKRPAKAPQRVKATAKKDEDAAETSAPTKSKREHPVSPPKGQSQTTIKRARTGPHTGKKRPTTTGGELSESEKQLAFPVKAHMKPIDLSGRIFEEDSPVDPKLVPGVIGQVSDAAKALIPANVL